MRRALQDLAKISGLLRDRELARLAARRRDLRSFDEADEQVAAAVERLRREPDLAGFAAFERWATASRLKSDRLALEREVLRAAFEAQRARAARAFGRAEVTAQLAEGVRRKREES